MPRLRDIAIGVFNDPQTAAAVNRQLVPVGEAVRYQLGRTHIVAPFAKLVVSTGPSPGFSSDTAALALNIADCYIPDALDGLEKADQATARQTARRLAVRALDAIQRVAPWPDGDLREIIDAQAAHGGLYRVTWKKLLRDRSRKRVYATVLEFDETVSRVVVECRDRTGKTMGTAIVAEKDGPVPLEFFFKPRDARLTEGRVDYLDRNGTVTHSVILPEC
jgi:hypothetical protein